jgi:hypothetical protein
VLLGSAMYAVPLKAERVLYLDTSLPQGGAADALGMGARVSKVKRLTPSGETPPLMYQASHAALVAVRCYVIPLTPGAFDVKGGQLSPSGDVDMPTSDVPAENMFSGCHLSPFL